MVYGITRIRNEKDIILTTLNHWSTICTGGIFIYDDKSTDNTVELCLKHPSVKKVIRGRFWDINRARAEFQNRQSILQEVLKIANPNDWIVYFDADEFLYNFDTRLLTNSIDGIICRLFDVYITNDNLNVIWTKRDTIGPEYREILFFFRVSSIIGYSFLDQRECTLKPGSNIISCGYIKHYGKGFSIKQWEDTCKYYSKYFPKYAKKWEARKGKAVHTVSDFGAELINFSDILSGKKQGFLLK